MTERKLTRREFLRVAATFGAAGALSACVPGGPQTVEKVANTLSSTSTLPEAGVTDVPKEATGTPQALSESV